MKKALLAFVLAFLIALPAHAQQNQNTLIPAWAFGQGVVMSTSTSPLAKLGAAALDLAGSFVTGTLPISKGGTGTGSLTGNRFLYTNAAGTTVLTAASSSLALPNAALQNSTISGTALGGTLAALTAGNSSLTLSGNYDGAAARTIVLNLGNANSWTALQQFANASTSLLSVYGPAYFGRTATTTIDSTGNVVLPSGANLTITGKTDGCATFATGVLNSTGVACGSGSGSSGLSTTTPLADSNILTYSAAGTGSAYGTATTSATINNGLTGLLTTVNAGGTQTIGLAAIAANSVLGNVSGGVAVPSAIATSSLYTGTNGQILARVGGAWIGVATTTISCTTIVCPYSAGNYAFSIGNTTITNAMLVNSTISGIALGSNLADLTATNSTLTFSGTYNGSAARTIGLNLGNANTWTALQTFSYASSTGWSSGYASSTVWRGGGLVADCDNAITSKLLWDTTTGQFSCGTDQTGGGGGGPQVFATTSPFAGTRVAYIPEQDNVDLVLGRASGATTTAPFWWDVSATTTQIGQFGPEDAKVTFGPVGTATSTIGMDASTGRFAISMSDVLGALDSLLIMGTTTTLSDTSTLPSLIADTAVRVGIGLADYLGFGGLLDHFVVSGRFNTQGWLHAYCDTPVGMTTIAADGLAGCSQYSFAEDATSTLVPIAGNGYTFGRLTTTVAAEGTGVWLDTVGAGFMRAATSTPVLEATARIDTVQNATTTNFFIGFTNVVTSGTAIDTLPTAGCFFTASSTEANWRAVCRTALNTGTYQDTGVASSSVITGTGAFRKFRIEMDATAATFYIQQSNGSLAKTNTITHSLTTQALNAGIHYARVQGTAAVNFDFFRLRTWWRDFVPAL